jgi:hypothetical protein
MALDREELAWAAGFFDGEGHTSPDGLSMEIYQTDPRPLERFRAAVGGIGKVSGPRPPARGSRKVSWTWDAYNWADTQAVIAMLWAFLSAPKRDQARKALMTVGPRRTQWLAGRAEHARRLGNRVRSIKTYS